VQAIDFIAGKAFEQAVLQHRPRASQPLLGWLKDEDRCPVEVTRLGEIPRGAEQHCRVAVVSAAMEAVGDRRSPGQIGLLIHRQRIHVGPQADRPPSRPASAQHADDTGAPDAVMRLEAPLPELRGDDGRGPMLLETDLGMRVKIPPYRREFVGERFDPVNRGHGQILVP
jgi:hypothetical protein